MKRIAILFLIVTMLLSAVWIQPARAEVPDPAPETAQDGSEKEQSEEELPSLEDEGSGTLSAEPEGTAAPDETLGPEEDPEKESPAEAEEQEEKDSASQSETESEKEQETSLPDPASEEEAEADKEEPEETSSEEESSAEMLRAAGNGCTIVIHSNGGSWYRPAHGEPEGALGEPEGSGTDRTFTKTIGPKETVILHNTDATLPTDYYLVGGEVEQTTRWLTWFTREGYVFHGWNVQAEANGGPTSHYAGRNTLDGGKMLTQNDGPSAAASNNFGQTVSFTMSDLGASAGDTIHLYAQWRRRYGVETSGALPGSSGVSLSTEGFASGSSLYNGVEVMIPQYQQDVSKKIETGGTSDLVWTVKNGIGRFWLKKALAKNTPYTTNKTLWVLLKDRAYDIYGKSYDVKITLSDIRIKASKAIDSGAANIFWVDMSNGEVICSVYPVSTGASYTVRVQILESGSTREVTGKRSMMLFRDLDIPDRLVGSANYQYRWNNGASAPGEEVPQNGRVSAIYPFAEAIRIPASTIAGTSGRDGGKRLYVQGDNSIVVAESTDAVRVTGTEYTGIQSSSYGQVLQRDTYKDGVAFPVITGNVSVDWTGNACGTTLFEEGEMNHVTSNVVEADGVTLVNGGAGSPSGNGTITQGGEGPRPYPFNSSAVYSMTPAEGHEIAKVWLDRTQELIIDGEEHTIPQAGTYKISKEGGTFTFVGIMAEHDIRVCFAEPAPAFGTLTVEKVVSGSMGSRDEAFHFTVRLTHPQGYDSYPDGRLECRKNGGDPQYLTLQPAAGEAGAAEVSFELTHGDRMTLYGLWEGTAYTVTEAEAGKNGYETDYGNAGGTIAAGQIAEVKVTNTRDMAVPTGVQLPDALTALLGGAAGILGMHVCRSRRKKR